MDSTYTRYILIDHENVHSLDAIGTATPGVKVLVFLGEQTTKLSILDVQKLLKHHGQIELITIAGNGRNALDFHIAYHAGRIAALDPGAHIHVVSRDKGFDPLIAHLHAQKVSADRCEEIPPLAARRTAAAPPAQSETKAADPRLERVIGTLTKMGKARPRKRKTLTSCIAALFGKNFIESEAVQLVVALEKAGKLRIDVKDNVSYDF